VKDIPINVDVECVDGSCGQSTCVIVDPNTMQVTHYVVKENTSPHTERLVPNEYIAEITPDLIRLRCTRAELGEMEPFVVTEYRQVEIPRYEGVQASMAVDFSAPEIRTLPMEVEQVPVGELALREGMPVDATDKSVGRVDELLLDSDTGQITHLVLREGHLWGQRAVFIPVSMVEYVVEGRILLKLDRETISAMLSIPARRGVANVELVVLTLPETNQANEALQILKKSIKDEDIAVLNMAVLVKQSDGQTSIRETEDVDPRHGALFGAITGGLIGLLGGPVGAVIGAAAGAATGGVAAGRIDMGFPDDYLKVLQQGLQPGSSALVVLVEKEGVEKVMAALANFDGQPLRHALTDDIVTQLSQASDTD
jgi:uncharacterized membrane protein/sporulation protein YlmC with PRC-barrel domain